MITEDIISVIEHKNRIVIIGDIHGDIKRFKQILNDAKIINNDLEWIAEPQDTVVVQLGDQIDSINRIPGENNWEVLDDISMIHFTNSIDNIAKLKGGRVISLIGNHEYMNTIGNFSYVSKHSQNNNRLQYFMPTGSLSPILSKRPIILKIGKLLFCHAGIKKHYFDVLEKYNKDIFYLNELWSMYMTQNKIEQNDLEIFNKIISHDDGILWTRSFESEENLQYIFNKLDCQYLFVGHTTVNKITLIANKIWLTDNGISRSYGNQNTIQYINIENMQIQVCTVNT